MELAAPSHSAQQAAIRRLRQRPSPQASFLDLAAALREEERKGLKHCDSLHHSHHPNNVHTFRCTCAIGRRRRRPAWRPAAG